MLNLVRTVSVSKRVQVPLHTALEALHDPPVLIKLGPLVIYYTADLSDPDFYTITDRFVLLQWAHIETKYTAKFTRMEDGVSTVVLAGAGTKLKTRWTAQSVEGGTELREESTVQALFFLMPFILRTLRTSHLELLGKLSAQLENQIQPPTLVPKLESSNWPIAISIPSVTLTFLIRILYPDFIYISTLAAIIGFLSITAWLFMKSKDPYDLFHLSLNKLPGENPNSNPKTEWLNMGYWKDTDVFPEACEVMALKLVQTAGCKTGGNVLDVGHGTGESLLMQLSHPSVPRPSHLTGITSLATHFGRAKDRVTRLQFSEDGSSKTKVTFYHGDAVHRPSTLNHPLDPSSNAPPYTAILALDCAYHFKTRHIFLQQSYARLTPGGRIALADICLLEGRPAKFRLFLLGIMPRENMISLDEYVRDLKDIGYVDVKVQDVSAYVFPGFEKFLKKRGWGWWLFGNVIRWYATLGARFVIVSGAKPVTVP